MTAEPVDPDDEGFPDGPSVEGIPPAPGHGGPRGAGGSGQQEAAAVRQNRALELRMAGATYQQIADALGWSNKGTAWEAVQAALARDDAAVAGIREEYRALQLARTERMLRGIWTKVVAGDGPMYDRALRTLERQAKLLGLDAPVQVSISDDTRSRITSMLDDLEGRIIPGEVVERHDEGLEGIAQSDTNQAHGDDSLGF